MKESTEKFASSSWTRSPLFSRPLCIVDKKEYLLEPIPDTLPRKPFYPSKFPNAQSRPCSLAPAPKPGKQLRQPNPDTFPKQGVIKDGLAATVVRAPQSRVFSRSRQSTNTVIRCGRLIPAKQITSKPSRKHCLTATTNFSNPSAMRRLIGGGPLTATNESRNNVVSFL